MQRIAPYVAFLIISALTAISGCGDTAHATTQTSIMPTPKIQIFDNSGKPLAGGLVYTALPGTTAGPGQSYPKATYTDSTGNTANANPVVLDSAGRANIWLNGFYKIAVYDSLGTLIYTTDNVSAVNNNITAPTLPWVDASSYSSLQAAVAAIGSITPTALYVTTAQMVSVSTTITANISLFALPSGSISVNSGQTLTINGPLTMQGGTFSGTGNITINGPFSAGLYQVFTGGGAVTGLGESYPEWWGAFGDGSTGHEAVNNAAIQAAVNSIRSTGGVVWLKGQYAKSGTVIVNRSQITLQGLNTGLRSAYNDTGFVGQGSKVVQTTEEPAFMTNVPYGTPAFPGHAYAAITYRDFCIWGPSTNGAAVGIAVIDNRWGGTVPIAQVVDSLLIENMSISHIGKMLQIWNCDAPRILHNWLCEGGKAMEVVGGYYALIDGNTVADNHGLPVDSYLYGGIHIAKEIHPIVSNTIGARNVRTVFMERVTDGIIHDNQINNDVVGIDVLNSTRNNFHHNSITADDSFNAGTPIVGIQIVQNDAAFQTEGNTIDTNIVKNTMAATTMWDGITLVGAFGHLVTKNTVSGSMAKTINLDAASSGNNVLDNNCDQTLYGNAGTNNYFRHVYANAGKIVTVATPYSNGWVAYTTGGFDGLKYWLDAEGYCHIDGATNGGVAGTTIFTLPIGYRPTTLRAQVIDGNGAAATIWIGTDGVVNLNSGAGPLIFNDVRFPLPLAAFQPQ